jgi:hypothetical protein
MEHFVTIFNKNYLPQGLCLYGSLKKNYKNFKLWVISLDDEVYEVLSKLNQNNIQAVPIKRFETQELKKIREQRTLTEFCWTLTPVAPKIIFNLENKIKRITYVDADFFFFRNPKIAFDEFKKSNKSILITEHDFDYDQKYKEKIVGKYIVQFVIFKKNKSEILRKWWEKKCIKKCSEAKDKNGIGDQKYLKEMTIKFKKQVHVLKNNNLFRSTWNYKKFNNADFSAWHFHGLKIINNNLIFLSTLNKIPDNIFFNIYLPYLRELKINLKKIKIQNLQKPKRKNYLLEILFEIYYFMIERKIIKNLKYSILSKIN